MPTTTIAELDRDDPLKGHRALFELPDGIIYLDGNSLGPLTAAARKRAATVVAEQWGGALIRAWNEHHWIDLPGKVGDRIGRLIGAPAGSVLACDTTSVNIFKLLAAALALRPDRTIILSDAGNFPTDLYIAHGLTKLMGAGKTLRVVPIQDIGRSLDKSVAAVLLTDVDYRTGERRDMAGLTHTIQASGALAIWDLCHSAGAMPTDVTAAGVDLAVGCSYKYLNGGPGAPAWLYVAPKHLDAVSQPLTGWLGHAAPFRFELDYRPAPSIARMLAGTPSVIALSVLDAALDAFDAVDMDALRAKSLKLADVFHARVAERCPEIERLTPMADDARGSQLAYRFEHGYAVIQALIDQGVIGDFRAPHIMRFGFTPLYLSYPDVARAGDLLADVLGRKPWLKPKYQARKAVT